MFSDRPDRYGSCINRNGKLAPTLSERRIRISYQCCAGGAIGVRRVIGFMPEASAFGPICVQFATGITLLRSLYVNARHGILASVVGLGLILMAWLSTSSTAYGGLAILGVVYAWNWIRRATSSNALGRKELMGELLVGVCLAIALLLILIVRANLLDPLFDVLDAVVFKKAETSSFYERAHWNEIAWDTVASTWGLGIGFGSTRTSNWFAAIVSNTGLLGALLMGIFLFQTFRKRLNWRTMITSELLPALKLSLLPSFAMLGVNSAGPDFGLWVGMHGGCDYWHCRTASRKRPSKSRHHERAYVTHPGTKNAKRSRFGRYTSEVPERTIKKSSATMIISEVNLGSRRNETGSCYSVAR